jgi:hypothetical protein
MEGEVGVRGNEIGWAVEHQWVTAALLLHWIGVRGQCEGLSTMARGDNGGPMRHGIGKRKMTEKWWCRSRRRGAFGAYDML